MMSPARRKQKSMWSPDVPALRSLGPRYEEHLHGRHAAVLLDVLTDKTASAAKNIALAGHYGSGKSSVILGVQASLDKGHINWVNLSLSSLGVGESQGARLQADGTPTPTTNLIQKEIVKQLLYRKAPADMPESKYFRIAPFRPWPAALWGGVFGITFFVVAALFGLVNRIGETAPRNIVQGHHWAAWAILAGFSAFLGGVLFLAIRALRNRVRVESVSAGGAAISLTAKENSYFDEYLDEIVYFFQKTKTRVAIFEDLDRFKDPHIFETLRELNTVLNNSEQIKERPVRFVYAVRDSIFDQLEAASESDDGIATLSASALESSPSANRTKFFDLVVPMVPFITHRSARDLLAAEFSQSDIQPSSELVNLVGAHLTDMRLIRNIYNEFEIYRGSVLGEHGLKGLTVDRLFAMMVYKNLYLEDFEAIRLGTSKIDHAYRAYRAMVGYQIDHQSGLSKEALDKVDSEVLWDARARAAGERLQEVLPIVHRAQRGTGEPYVRLQSQNYDLRSVASGPFWQSVRDSGEGVTLMRTNTGGGTNLSFLDLLTLAGETAAQMDRAVEADRAHLERESRLALETKQWVAKASMGQLMGRADLVMPTDDGERSLDAIMQVLVSPLAHELLAKGYLDENFTLYCSDYHDVAISVSAMNFILHCVQADRFDYRFEFDNASSIEAVEEEMGTRFLDGESVFNIEVFDHYLTNHPAALSTALDKLALRVATDSSFVDAYLADGAAPGALVSRLADRWAEVFVHLIEKAVVGPEATLKLIDVAAHNSVPGLDYDTSERVADYLSRHYARMAAFTDAVDVSKAAALAALLRCLGVLIGDLRNLGENQRESVISAGLYALSRANLSTALGEGTALALDVVKSASEAVYRRILGGLGDYLDLLRERELTIQEAEAFIDIIGDVANAAEINVKHIAQRASEACKVIDLEELDEAAWRGVVAAGRFAPSAWNVSRFISRFGVSDELVASLEAINLSDVAELTEEARFELAYELAAADKLPSATRIRLIRQLGLPSALDPTRLAESGLEVLPGLLEAELVPDNASTYACVSGYPFTFREGYFAASRKLASYVCQLPLSSDDLVHLFRSRRVAPTVKRALADDGGYVRGRLSRNGAIAISTWAATGNEVSVDLLVALSEAGAPAEDLLNLLDPHLQDIDMAALDQILRALGDEYEALTRVGRHRPRLRELPGTERLLEELKNRGLVSSFGPASWRGGLIVNMRH